MNIQIIRRLEEAGTAFGLAVVIDVFRAFTTEAYILANGAEKILPVLNLDEAFRIKKENPDFLLIGERKGVKVEGFDFGNGPSEVVNVDFTGKTVIHTTSNGTKGLLNASNAKIVLAGSFVLASSIVSFIKKNNIQDVSFVSTSPDRESENEDVLLAYYIKDLLNGEKVDEVSVKNKLISTSAVKFLQTEAGVPQADFDLCLDFNRLNFVIKKVVKNNIINLVKENI